VVISLPAGWLSVLNLTEAIPVGVAIISPTVYSMGSLVQVDSTAETTASQSMKWSFFGIKVSPGSSTSRTITLSFISQVSFSLCSSLATTVVAC